MKLLGVVMLAAGLIFGAGVISIIVTARSHVGFLLLVGGPLIASCEILVGAWILANGSGRR
jgi:hypothetical protein